MPPEITPEIQALIDAAMQQGKALATKEQLSGLEALKTDKIRLEAEKTALVEEGVRARRAAVASETRRIAGVAGLLREQLLALPELVLPETATTEQITAAVAKVKEQIPEAFAPAPRPGAPTIPPITIGLPPAPPAGPVLPAIPTEHLMPDGIDFRELQSPDGSFSLQTAVDACTKKGISFMEWARKCEAQSKPQSWLS